MRSSHVVIRRNRVGNLVSNGFYLDNCSNALVEQNITWGDKDGRYNPQGAFAAVAIGQEDFTAWGTNGPKDSTANVIRNNLFAGFGVCMWAFQYEGPRRVGKKIGFVAYGNSCVAQRTNAIFFEQSIGQENVTEIVVANNIFNSNYADRDCSSITHPRIKFKANSWPARPSSAACIGPSDVYGDPRMKASIDDLASRTNVRQPTAIDFSFPQDSPVLSAGLSLPYNRFLVLRIILFSFQLKTAVVHWIHLRCKWTFIACPVRIRRVLAPSTDRSILLERPLFCLRNRLFFVTDSRYKLD